jgi:hypothetical protein
MRPAAVGLLLLMAAGACDTLPNPERDDSLAVVWRAGPPLPAPVSNNAVAAVDRGDGVSVFSFLGMGASKTWDGVTNAAYRWDVGSADGWRTLPPVPGPGRLASTAQVVDGRVYVLGGYTVAQDGTERSLPDVNVFDPVAESWTRGADIPVPVDDAVSAVWRDSLIVLVSGWHDDGNVSNVQWYDPAADRWTQGSPIPGTPVFGHTGALVGDHLLYLDGAKVVEGAPRFALDTAAWLGNVDPSDPHTVEWTAFPEHPLPGLYRAAGGNVGGVMLFVGGTDNPYNFDGIGYDGVPSRPIRQVLAYAPGAGAWRNLAAPPLPSMDHRNLGVAGGAVFLVGGMEEGQAVSSKVWYAGVEALLQSIW